MKKLKSYNKDRKGTIISLLLLCFVLTLSVGYSVMNKELTISTEAAFRVEKDIRVTGISLKETTNSGIEEYKSNYSTDIIKVGITLPNNNSSVTYRVKVTNYSNTPMRITNIDKTVTNNNYTVAFNKTIPLTVGKLSEEEIEITFSNNTNTSQTVNSVLQFTFAKSEAIMTIGSNGAATTTFYNGTLTKDSIEMVKFMPTKEIPNDAIGYWDVSYTAGANEVIAYYLDEDENGLYELYIAADGEVYAPSDSGYLFMNFVNAESIDFNDSFNTSKVTNMSGYRGGMFYSCSSLLELDVTGFNTDNVIYMGSYIGGMFGSCSKLEELDLSSFNTENVTDMTAMFANCKKLGELDLSNFDTRKVTSMGGTYSGMFYSCSELSSLTFGKNFKTDKVNNMWNMFYGCSKLEELDVSSFNTENVTELRAMFYGCNSLTSLDLSGFKTDKVNNMWDMFNSCIKLEELDVSSFNTKNVTNMRAMFANCSSLSELNLENFNTSKVANMLEMFDNCSSLTTLNISNFITSSVTDMVRMFYNCSSLTVLNLSNFVTSNVINMGSMFYNCSSLTSLDLSTFDTRKVTVMNDGNKGMFHNCTSLTNIILGNNFDTSNISTMKYMFSGCSSLTSLDLSNFNTQNVKNMYGMFRNCRSLISLDLSNFSIQNTTNVGYMFYSCIRLADLDIRGMDFENKTVTTTAMFESTPAGSTVYVKNAYNKSYIENIKNTLNVVIA